jgi:hypothetical protein
VERNVVVVDSQKGKENVLGAIDASGISIGDNTRKIPL